MFLNYPRIPSPSTVPDNWEYDVYGLYLLSVTVYMSADVLNKLLSQSLQQENAELQAAVSLAQAQLETALSAQESQKRVLETLNAQLATRLQELAGIHREIATALQTWEEVHNIPYWSSV